MIQPLTLRFGFKAYKEKSQGYIDTSWLLDRDFPVSRPNRTSKDERKTTNRASITPGLFVLLPVRTFISSRGLINKEKEEEASREISKPDTCLGMSTVQTD